MITIYNMHSSEKIRLTQTDIDLIMVSTVIYKVFYDTLIYLILYRSLKYILKKLQTQLDSKFSIRRIRIFIYILLSLQIFDNLELMIVRLLLIRSLRDLIGMSQITQREIFHVDYNILDPLEKFILFMVFLWLIINQCERALKRL